MPLHKRLINYNIMHPQLPRLHRKSCSLDGGYVQFILLLHYIYGVWVMHTATITSNIIIIRDEN